MLRSQEKTPLGIRIAEIILDAIGIGLSGIVLSNPDTTTVLLIMYLGFALTSNGIARMVDVISKQVSKGFKGITIRNGYFVHHRRNFCNCKYYFSYCNTNSNSFNIHLNSRSWLDWFRNHI